MHTFNASETSRCKCFDPLCLTSPDDNCGIALISFKRQLRFQLSTTRNFSCWSRNKASRTEAARFFFFKTPFQACLMAWWLSDSSRFSSPRARAFFHRRAAHPVFLFSRGTRKDARRQVAKRKRKKTRGGVILRVWSCRSPRSTWLAEVSRCVWYATVSYVAPRRPREGPQSSRRLEDSMHMRAMCRTACELCILYANPLGRFWKSSWIAFHVFYFVVVVDIFCERRCYPRHLKFNALSKMVSLSIMIIIRIFLGSLMRIVNSEDSLPLIDF